MSYFNSQGELNASSVKEAIEILSKYASLAQSNLPSNMFQSTSSGMSDERRDELISRALSDQNGKIALAQSMANPIN